VVELILKIGMWKRRFEKEDAKVAKAAEMAAKAQDELNSAAITEVEGYAGIGVNVEKVAKERKELDPKVEAADMKARRDMILGRLAKLAD
jgi:hypothetical protein